MNLNERRISNMRIVQTAAALAVTALLALPAHAQDKPKTGEAPKAPSPEEMMKAWTAAATPGEAHKKLEPIVGSFDVKTTSWMAPGKPPEETVGTSESKWVLGNRFVEENVTGTMMGQPFSGVGYTGYDNYKKKYVGAWMDSMGTAWRTGRNMSSGWPPTRWVGESGRRSSGYFSSSACNS
jgi:hypothetical protein